MTRCLSDAGPFVLLASYPKSGNTWVRACLTGYLTDQAPDLSGLIGRPIFGNRQDFDDFTALASADLTLEEIDAERPAFHRGMAATATPPLFVKAHDAWYRNVSGEPLFGRDSCRGAVCIVRHPAAIAVSFAHHAARTIDNIIATMADPGALHDWWPDAIDTRLPQRLSSWSSHVASWLDQAEIPVMILRYEDILADPVGSIAALLEFSGVDVDLGRAGRAVEAARFDRLRQLEEASGFRESPSERAWFFRAGVADSWSSILTPAQRAQIAGDHGAMMRRLGFDLE